jgi:mono/diheme cytochrome c family protein
MRSIYLALLDAEDRSVKQMRSFVTLQPGEQRSCVGCHEYRTETPLRDRKAAALRRAPSRIAPITGVPEILDFPRDVQPILDRHCVECHRPGRREGGIELTGDRGPTYSLAFYNLLLHRQVKDNAGYGWEGIQNVGGRPAGNDAPYTTYSSASPLMDKLGTNHFGVCLSAHERTVVRLWIDTAAQYAGTYAAYGTGQIGAWWRNNEPIREMANDWPTTAPALDAMQRRCASCHGNRMPRFVTDQIALDGYGDLEGWQRPTTRYSRHTIFNLTHPEQSVALMATLSREAGGYAVGPPGEPKPVPGDHAKAPKPVTHPVIFADTQDPDYVKILAHLRAAAARLDEIKRFDMPGFKPRAEYVREMKRFGVLPASFDLAKEPINVYEIDRQYWRLFWHEGEDNH